MEKLSKKACEAIIEASQYWNGEDEDKHPELKRIRTLCGSWIDDYKNDENNKENEFKKFLDKVYSEIQQEYQTDELIWHYKKNDNITRLIVEPVEFNSSLELINNIVNRFGDKFFEVITNVCEEHFLVTIIYNKLPLEIIFILYPEDMSESLKRYFITD